MNEQLEKDIHFWRTPPNVRRAYMSARFGQVHYRISQPQSSTKRPLLCFHLSPGSSRTYNLFLAEIGRDRLCIAPDTPGFGESDPPDKLPEIEDYAACMGDLIDEFGLDKIDLMGYHTGCKIALALTRQRPKQVKRLILVSAPIYTEKELARQRETMGHAGVDQVNEDGSHLTRRWANQQKWIDRSAPLIFRHREVVESLRGGSKAWWGHRAAFQRDHKDLLRSVEHPILILCPNDDLWEPTKRSKSFLKNGKFLELPNYAHGMLDVHTKEIVKIAQEFLNTNEEPHPETMMLPSPAPPAKPLRPIRRAFMDGSNGQIHYRMTYPMEPRKTPLFCMHMSPNSGRIFESILTTMGTDRIAIAPDTPGFGESDAPAKAPTIDDYASAMAHVIDNLGIGQVDIMGYHTGSITCIALATQRPDLVRRIIQISCPVYTDEELAERRVMYGSRPLEPGGQHLENKWKHMVPFYGPTVPRWIIARNFAEGLRGGPLDHWGHQAAFSYDLRKVLPKIKNPILVVNPNDDIVEQTPRGLDLIQNGQLFEITELGHGFIDLMTDTFSNRLREFLDFDKPQ